MTLRAQLRFLRVQGVVSTLFMIVLLVGAARGGTKKFDTIDAERINILEKDGRVRLVISNKARSPAPMQRRQEFGNRGGTRAGMIFYNDEGTENGGLIFSGSRDAHGEYEAVGSLTFDQYEQDQTVALQYVDGNGRRRAGLTINDYPLGITSLDFDRRLKAAQALTDTVAKADSLKVLRALGPKTRLYMGRNRSGASMVTLSDALGRSRLRLSLDSVGAAAIEFLDENGQVTRRIP